MNLCFPQSASNRVWRERARVPARGFEHSLVLRIERFVLLPPAFSMKLNGSRAPMIGNRAPKGVLISWAAHALGLRSGRQLDLEGQGGRAKPRSSGSEQFCGECLERSQRGPADEVQEPGTVIPAFRDIPAMDR